MSHFYRLLFVFIVATGVGCGLAFFTGLAPGAEPAPAFVVVNKCPPVTPFVVENKTGPVPVPPGQHWVRYPGEPWKLEPITPTTGAPGVAPAPTFHPGHQCPTCGRSQFVVAGWNRDGTHQHRCPADGTVWSH